MQCVDNLLTVLQSGLSCHRAEWWISGIYWLEESWREASKERVSGRCASEVGGYNHLSSSPQDTSHTSLVGGGKVNGSSVCCERIISDVNTHTQTHTPAPITHILSLELTGWVMLTGNLSRKKGMVGKRWERGKSDGRVKAGEGEQRGENKQRGDGGETASGGTRQNESCLPVTCHTL